MSRYHSQQVKVALKERFCAPEFAIFFEVASGTGMNSKRYADAVAMNLYPSRGLEINGFEIKVSRSDWLNELKNPAKAEEIAQYCQRWWIVAPPDIVKPEELPPTWGLLIFNDGKLRQHTAAPKLKSKPVNAEFMAALIRRAGEFDSMMMKETIEKETKNLRDEYQRKFTEKYETSTRAHRELKEKLKRIEDICGINLSGWIPDKTIGAAIKSVITAGVTETHSGLNNLKSQIARIQKDVDDAISIFGAPIDDEHHKQVLK